jgi:hypothetical protein
MGTGTAQITISGATVDIRSPFRSVSTNIFGASGFLGAVGGQSATINVDATNGHLLLGSNLFPSGVNKPFLFAQSQTGPATIDLQATDGPLEVQRTVTPLISNSSVARYFTLYADALGSGSANVNLTTTGSTGGDILLDGGIRTSTPGGVANIALLTNEGISITSDALLLAEGRAANASISASDSTGTTGLISIDGDISALGRGSAQINVRNEGTGGIRLRGSLLASAESFFAQARFYSSGGTVDLAGAVQAIAPNFAMVDAITFINSNRMIIDGQLTAQADTNPYLYLFHQGTDFSIGSNALIESKSPTGAQADMDIAFGGALNIQDGALISAGSAIDIHTQSLQLDGAIRASRLSGDVTITIGPAAGPVTVGSTGLIQVQGGSGSGSHQIFIGSGTQNITNVQVDGVIEAVGAGQRSNVFINAGGINVTSGGRISAVNTGLGLGSIQLRSFSSGGIIAPGSIEAKQLLAINLGGGGIQITNPIVDGINLANVGSGSTGIIYTDPDLVQINQLRSDNGDIVINAGSITIGGSVLANGTADVILRSANDIVFGGFNQTMSGDVVILDASLGGSVISGTNTITANALSVLAANSIDLGFASIAVNNGIVPQTTYQFGDALMLSELASLGVTVPSVPIANAAFRALDINLGTFDFFGDYLYLQADQLTLNSAIGTWLPGTEPTPGTVNPDVIVQMQPYTQTQAIAIESLMPSSQLTGTTYFTQADHFSRFPGTTLLLGGASFAGPMFIGQNGTVNIGTKNFLALTSGPVTGAGNIVTSPPGLISVIGGVPTSPPSTTSSTTTTSTSTTLTSTEVVTTYVQQTTISDPTSPTEIGGSTITEEAVEMNLPVEEAVAGITPSEEETTSGTAAGNEPTIESSSEEAVAGTPLSEEETASGTEPGNEPTIESSSEEAVAGTTSSEEETASGTEAEDESAIELFSDEPIDMVAALEQQPLVETYLEINGITLACQ